MCDTCGCSNSADVIITDVQSGRHVHLHGHDEHAHSHHAHGHHTHDHVHEHHGNTTVHLQEELLQKNSRLAERNRGWLEGRGILAVNLMSSPGSGKTALLERTIREVGTELAVHVVEGDQATSNDAERIRATGARVIQINTGTGCHLDALMLRRALEQLNPSMNVTVMIENVGNLVCPALFDLGERVRVVVASVTEGEDKPEKYPHMFRAADAILLNKVDLLPYVTFSVARFQESLSHVNAKARLMQVSVTRGDGLSEWYDWLRSLRVTAR